MKNKSTEELQKIIQTTSIDKLDDVYKNIAEYDFISYLESIILKRNIKKVNLLTKQLYIEHMAIKF